MKRNKPANQADFPVFPGLPAGTTNSQEFSREELSKYLGKFGDLIKMAEIETAKYQKNKKLASEFSYEDNRGEMDVAIVKTVNAWETYWNRKKGIKNKTDMNISATTDLSSFGLIIGYFKRTYTNHMIKKYVSFCTEKRSALKQVIYLDEVKDNGVQHIFEAQMASKVSGIDKVEYKNSINYILQKLRQHDRELNAQISKAIPAHLLKEKRSYFAKLFTMLINPKVELDDIRKEFGWSEFVFRTKRDNLFAKIKKDCSEVGQSILDYIDNTNLTVMEEEKSSKKNVAYQNKAPREVHSVYGMKKEGNITKYFLTIQVNQMVERKWQKVKDFKTLEIEATGDYHNLSFDEAKTILTSRSQESLSQAKAEIY